MVLLWHRKKDLHLTVLECDTVVFRPNHAWNDSAMFDLIWGD